MWVDKIKSRPTSSLTNIQYHSKIRQVIQVKCVLNAIFIINVCRQWMQHILLPCGNCFLLAHQA